MRQERYEWKDVERYANGNWDAILTYHGFEVRKMNQNGPCPLCGGHDRQHFFIRDGRILSYCRGQCGNSGPDREVSTPEHLIMQRNNWSFPEMVRSVARFLQVTPSEKLEEYRRVVSRKIEQPIQMPASHCEDHEKAMAALQKCECKPTHGYLLSANTAPMNDCLELKGRLAVELYSGADQLVNVAALGGKEIHYAAGGPSFGATARLEPAQEHDGSIILVQDYAAAWRVWWKRKGASRVLAAISAENFLWMLGRMKTSFTHVAADHDSMDELREKGFEVIELADVYSVS